MMICICV